MSVNSNLRENCKRLCDLYQRLIPSKIENLDLRDSWRTWHFWGVFHPCARKKESDFFWLNNWFPILQETKKALQKFSTRSKLILKNCQIKTDQMRSCLKCFKCQKMGKTISDWLSAMRCYRFEILVPTKMVKKLSKLFKKSKIVSD